MSSRARRDATVGALDVVVRSELVSQHTSLQVLGMPPRTFLEWLPRSGLRVIPRGKLRLVRVDDAIAALAGDTLLAPESAARSCTTEAESADEILAALGLRSRRTG